MPESSHFDILLLIARPAAGKIEIIDYLKNIPDDERLCRFHIGTFAEIDESTWAAQYSTTSCPFDKPKPGKTAVKVINHYADEVLNVYEVK